MNNIKKFWPLVFLVLFILLAYKPYFLNGKLPIPGDTIVGLYHPWRDFFSTSYPQGKTYKNYLITDSVRQQFPWRKLAIETLKNGKLPWWNPYSFSGMPLLANLQSASLYPLNIIFTFTSFVNGWGIQVISQSILGAIFMYLFLREIGLRRESSVMGTLSWIGCGFFIAWLEWNTTVQVAIWVPLSLLAIEKYLLGKRKIIWAFIFIFSLTSSFLAGYLQPFFYVFLLVNSYLIFRLAILKKLKYIFIFMILEGFVLLITAIQWMPLFQLIGNSARDIDQSNWNKPDWFLPWQHLVQFISPDFFGNPATLNYFGIWNYQEFVGYVGIIPLFFAISSFWLVKQNIVKFFLVIFGISMIFLTPNPIAKIPFEFHFPFLSTAQPSRLIMIVDFSLALLSAFGFEYYIKEKFSSRFSIILLFLGSVLSFLFVWSVSNSSRVSLNNLYLPIIIFISLVIGIFASTRLNKFKYLVVCTLLLVTTLDLARFFIKFESFSNPSDLYPKTLITSFLEKKSNAEQFRVAALDDRIMPPNFSVDSRIQMISGYDPLYLKRYGEFIVAMERGNPNKTAPFGFNRIITPKNYRSSLFNLLGVKYLLTFETINDSRYKLILSEGTTKLYEDTKTLPRAYLVKNIIRSFNDQSTLNYMFTNFNPAEKAVVQTNDIIANNLSTGMVYIVSYQDDEVVLNSDSIGDSFLVLTDIYFPGWQAEVDGNKAKIYLTDYTFRGIKIPAGKHVIRFFYRYEIINPNPNL